MDGQLLFHADQQADKDRAMETIIGRFVPYAQLQKEHPKWPFMVITDQNLLSEYRHSGKIEGIREFLNIPSMSVKTIGTDARGLGSTQ